MNSPKDLPESWLRASPSLYTKVKKHAMNNARGLPMLIELKTAIFIKKQVYTGYMKAGILKEEK